MNACFILFPLGYGWLHQDLWWLLNYGTLMSTCVGEIATGTKVDREMREFIEAETERLGVSNSEFHRRLLELYRESRREAVDCPHCSNTVVFDMRE